MVSDLYPCDADEEIACFCCIWEGDNFTTHVAEVQR